MSITNKIVKGISWSLLTQIIHQGLQFLTVLTLARLLTPKDFGLVGTAALFTGFVGIFKGVGLASSVLQKAEVTQEELSSVFWMNIFIGLLLMILLWFSAPFVTKFFGASEVNNLIRVLSLSFPLSALSAVQMILLQKKLSFKVLGVAGIISELSAASIAIFCALKGAGFWAIVIKDLAAGLSLAIVFGLFVKTWRPSFHFNLNDLNRFWNFGLYRTGTSVFDYWRNQADYLIISKMLGAEALGYYMLAFNLVKYPINKALPLLNQVFFPAIVSIQGDIEQVKKVHVKMVRYLVLAGLPLMLGISLIAPELIWTLYGEKWLSSIPILQILSIWGIIMVVTSQFGTLLLALGKADQTFKLAIFSSIIIVPGLYFGAHFGLVGVALFWLIAAFLLFELYRRYAHRLIALTLRELIASLQGTVAIALLAAFSVLVMRVLVNAFLPNISGIGILVLYVATGILFLTLFYFWFESESEIRRARYLFSNFLGIGKH